MKDIILELESLVNETLADFQKLKEYGIDKVNKIVDGCTNLVKTNEKNFGHDKGKLTLANTFLVAQTMEILQEYCSTVETNIQQLNILDDRINKLENLLVEVRKRA